MERFLKPRASHFLFEADSVRISAMAHTDSPGGVNLTLIVAEPTRTHPASPSAAADDSMDIDDEEEDSDEILERPKPSKRKRAESASDLSPDQKQLIMDLLLKRDSKGNHRMSCPDVLKHLEFFHPKLASVSLSSLQHWRLKQTSGVPHGPKPKRGRTFVLAPEHRSAIGALIKEMGEAGSPMDYKFARPVILGYLEDNDLMHLYSPTKALGKITLSQVWINELFLEHKLAARKKTTDAQNLPEVSLSLC
jgi:hypothetical protein